MLYHTRDGLLVSGNTAQEVVAAIKAGSPLTAGLTLNAYVKQTVARLRAIGAPIADVRTPEQLFAWWVKNDWLRAGGLPLSARPGTAMQQKKLNGSHLSGLRFGWLR